MGVVGVRALAVPMGSDGVREYRIKRPARMIGGVEVVGLDDVYGDRDVETAEAMNQDGELVPKWKMEALAKWLGEKGLEWDVFWTNHYGPDSQVVQDVMRDQKVPVAVDVDDWFEDVPHGNEAFREWWGMKRRWYNAVLEEADRVVCSTPILAERYGGVVAPNFVDPGEWGWEKRKKKDDSVVLLSAGGIGRAGDYLAKEGAFKRFLEEPNTKIVFMGPFPEWALGYKPGKVVWCRWVPFKDYNRVARWIAPDLFVSPLEHNRFNEAKSNLKWLEAGVLESCFVGERWGEYARTVEEDADGVLADTDEEWAEKLVDLARNPQKAAEIAGRGRKSVLENWTWQAVEPQWRAAVLGEDHGISAERISGSSVEHPAAANG